MAMSNEKTSIPLALGDRPEHVQEQDPSPNMGESNVVASNDTSVNMETASAQNETGSTTPNEDGNHTIRQTSDVWNHFKRQKIGKDMKAVCNYCGKQLLGESRQGTSHLRTHFKTCKLRTTRDIRQAFLKTEKKGDETLLTGSLAFNQELGRCALAKMIVAHEYPMVMVDHYFFRQFLSTVAPLFKVVSRNTIRSDIMKIYSEQKENTRKLLSKNSSRIAITTDMWTSSNQNLGYMAVTAHFIDDSWTLQSRLVRFIYVPAPHTSQVLGDVLVQCLLDWGLERKISTLTLDNCSTNDAMIEHILGKLPRRHLILGGSLIHMRCCAHILNLIVKDGLSVISSAIEKVRESVNFWTATPKREEKFKETCVHLNICYNKKLVLDYKTRWNSTFLMLKVAIEYKDVFDRLSQRDNRYKTLPSDDEWDMAKEICQRLELFYDVTKLFSGTLYPTANICFPKICRIKLALVQWLNCSNNIISRMASSMMTKFDKYWGIISGVMAVGTVLDPRYKIELLDYYFPLIYGEQPDNEIERIKGICHDLVKEYEMRIKGNNTSSSSVRSMEANVCIDVSSDAMMSEFERCKRNKQISIVNRKTDLDVYLEEPALLDSEKFNILGWWEHNATRYPIMGLIARDFFAVPISTVASESSFSTGGRFLTPHRSRLRSDTLEAMMCVQDWMWINIKGSSKSQADKDNIEYSNTILTDIDDDIEPFGQCNVIEEAEESIGGNKEALQALRELIIFPYLYISEAKQLGHKWPRGLLLYGPPGTGKTSLVRAVVRECDAHLTVISPHLVHRSHAGEGEIFLREAFSEAISDLSSGKPSVVFVDEIDGICQCRDSRSEQDVRVTTQLMVLMDSISIPPTYGPQVVVVASTNRIEAIDPAFRRYGRFCTEVEVTAPCEEARHDILKLYTRNMKMHPDVNLRAIAASSNSYVGADLEALCREAVISAGRKSSKEESTDMVCLTMGDWDVARSIVRPSMTKGVTVEIPKVSWEDIGGLKDVKKQLQRAVEWPIKHSAAFSRLGITPVRGVLLHGPPGCSKTTLAKATAHATQASFFSLSGADLYSMYVGEGETLLRNTFRRARLATPSIIFFDEADVVGAKRGGEGGNNHVGERLLSTLLTEMDGLEDAKGILVLAATNRPHSMDAALMRPGRFDLVIYVPPPDIESRYEILQVHTRNMKLGKDVNLRSVAEKTELLTGAELEGLCNEAAIVALREDISACVVSHRHFSTATRSLRPRLTREDVDSYFSFMQTTKTTSENEFLLSNVIIFVAFSLPVFAAFLFLLERFY